MKTLAKIAVMLTALTALIACSGPAEPAPVAAPTNPSNAATASSTPPGATATPVPTIAIGSAERLSPEALNRPQATSVPTPAPRAAAIQPTSAASQTGADHNTAQAQAPGPTNPNLPAIEAPTKPQFTDQVLLQDIYATMDLNRFALNPEEPIPFPKYQQLQDREDYGKMYDLTIDDIAGKPYQSYFEYNVIKEHPYLHVFPGLKYSIRAMEQAAKDNPRNRRLQIRPAINYEPYPTPGRPETEHEFTRVYGIDQFIYNPWFERISIEELYRQTNITARFNFQRRGKTTLHPPSFGKGSPREVLATTVGNLLQEARLPETEPFNIPFEAVEYSNPTIETDLADYLRIAILPMDRQRWKLYERGSAHYPYPAYSAPKTQWEIIHPELPIIRVNTYVETYLPITRPGMDPEKFLEGYSYRVDEATAARKEARAEAITRLAVSFVMTLQNRWTSFEDPNRWITRFQEDMQPIAPKTRGIQCRRPFQGLKNGYLPKDGSLDPEEHLHFPNYWHPSDYMQHRIIGPVVMTVYQSPVLAPGNYSQAPTVTHWEAPGPIIPTEKLLDPEPRINHLQLQPLLTTPNPGYPLPGHILAYPFINEPGTEVWEEFGLEGNW